MQKREQELLRLLRSLNDWSTAAQLAGELSCSVRTIKSCIAGLNQRWPGLIFSSHKGFRLNATPALLEKVQTVERANHIPQDAESRRSYILRKLLLEKDRYDLDEMAKELCIAPATLNNELSKLRPVLLDFHLMLRTKANRLSIRGSDADKKRLACWLIYNETLDFINDLQLMNDYFPDLNLTALRRTVTDCLTRNKVLLDEFSLSNLLLNIAISVERNRHAFASEPETICHRALSIPETLRRTVDEFCAALEAQLEVSLTAADRYGFCALLLTRAISGDEFSRREALEPTVGRLAGEILQRIREVFDLELASHTFTERFAIYLQNILIRYHGGMHMRHPQLERIRGQNPYIYHIAVFVACEMEQRIGVHISEDEIGYLALHLGGQILEVLNGQNKVHALLLYAGYYGNGLELMQRIRSTFRESLQLQGMILRPENLSRHPDCALLISTTSAHPSMPTVQIGEYLDNRDIAALATRIDDVRRAQVFRRVAPPLRRMLRPDLFWYAPSFSSREEALRTMGGTLEQRGFVPEGFCERLLAMETFSSSAVGGLALPHAPDVAAKVSALAVANCPRALSWGSNRVHLIFLPVLRQEDNALFRDLYLFLSHVVPQTRHLKELRAADNFEDFLQALCPDS